MCEVIPRLPNLVNPHSLAVGEENAVVAWQYDGGNSESNVEYYIEVLYRVFDKTTKRVEFKENVPKGMVDIENNFNTYEKVELKIPRAQILFFPDQETI